MRALHPTILAAAVLCASFAAAPSARAIELEPEEELIASNPEFVRGRRAIEARDWDGAIAALTAADRRTPNRADIHNLLGYAHRNAGHLERALEHYRRALQIDPAHRGAHEYIGEALLMLGDLAGAEKHYAALERLCERVCEERDDLGRKIAEFRSRRR